MCDTSPTTWTPDAIRSLLDRNPIAVERAIVAIYRRQTEDEQRTDETRHHNNVGFAACHARRGSYYARWILSGKRLTGIHADLGRKIARCYAGQLAEIAASKAPNPAAAQAA